MKILITISLANFCLILLALTPSAFAGIARVGNGGGAAICQESNADQLTHVHFYDFIEAQRDKRWKAMTFPEEATPREVVAIVLRNLERLDKHFAQMLLTLTYETFDRFQWDDIGVVYHYDDPERLWLPDNCHFTQISNIYMVPDDGVYFGGVMVNGFLGQVRISKTLWEQLSTRDKAGLMIHESLFLANNLYSFKNQTKQLQNQAVRRLTAFMFSTQAQKFTRVEFRDFVSEINYSQKLPLLQLNDNFSRIIRHLEETALQRDDKGDNNEIQFMLDGTPISMPIPSNGGD